jgi:hypothetical protein
MDTTQKPILSRTLHNFPTVCSIIWGGGWGGGGALKFGSSERSRVGWPEIAATFGVGGLPAGGRAHIISRTVKLFGQGEGDVCKCTDIWRQLYEANSRLWGLTASAIVWLLSATLQYALCASVTSRQGRRFHVKLLGACGRPNFNINQGAPRIFHWRWADPEAII